MSPGFISLNPDSGALFYYSTKQGFTRHHLQSVGTLLFLHTYLPSCLSACLPVCLTTCLPACLPTCLSVCLPLYKKKNPREVQPTARRLHGQPRVGISQQMPGSNWGQSNLCGGLLGYLGFVISSVRQEKRERNPVQVQYSGGIDWPPRFKHETQ